MLRALQAGSIAHDKVRITQRVLTVSLHNGHTTVQRSVVRLGESFLSDVQRYASSQQHYQAQPAAALLGGLALPGSTLLGADADITLRGYSPHESMAVSVALEYVIAEPTPLALQVVNRRSPPMPHTALVATAAAPPPSIDGAPSQRGDGAAEQLRHVLVAQHVYIPASPIATAPSGSVDGPVDTPPRRLLVLSNRAVAADPLKMQSFTRQPWELPLLSPNAGLRLNHALPMSNASEIETVLSEPALHRGFGPLNIVVGATLSAVSESAPGLQNAAPTQRYVEPTPQPLRLSSHQPLADLPRSALPHAAAVPLALPITHPRTEDKLSTQGSVVEIARDMFAGIIEPPADRTVTPRPLTPPQQAIRDSEMRRNPDQLTPQSHRRPEPEPQPLQPSHHAREPDLQPHSRRDSESPQQHPRMHHRHEPELQPQLQPYRFHDREPPQQQSPHRHIMHETASYDERFAPAASRDERYRPSPTASHARKHEHQRYRDDDSPESFQDSPGGDALLPVFVQPLEAPQQQPARLESLLSRIVALPVANAAAPPTPAPAVTSAASWPQDYPLLPLPPQPAPQDVWQQAVAIRGSGSAPDTGAWGPQDASSVPLRRSAAAELASALREVVPLGAPAALSSPGSFGWALSLADRERLLRWGFTNVLRVRGDGGVVNQDDFGPRRAVNLALELSDPMPATTVTLQFAAVSLYSAVTGLRRVTAVEPGPSRTDRPPHSADDDDDAPSEAGGVFEVAHPRALYFTFQFYCAAPVRTQPALLLPDAPAAAAAAAGPARDARPEVAGGSEPIATFMLARVDTAPGDGAAENASSLVTVSIDVDPTALAPHAHRDFIEYLCDVPLHVEAWDADSLLPFGSALIHLGPLLRQQRGSAASARQYELVSGMMGAGTGAPVSGAADYSSTRAGQAGLMGTPIGRLQVVMLATGHSGSGAVATDDLRTAARSPMTTAAWGGPGPSNRLQSGSAKASVRVRARPLASSDPHLSALLRSQGAGRQRGAGASADRPAADATRVADGETGGYYGDATDMIIAAVDDVTPPPLAVPGTPSPSAATAWRLSSADVALLRQLFAAEDAPGLIEYRRLAHFIHRGAAQPDEHVFPARVRSLAFSDAPPPPRGGSRSSDLHDRTLPQLQAALSVSWARAVAIAAVDVAEPAATGTFRNKDSGHRPAVGDVSAALDRSFMRASALVQVSESRARHSFRGRRVEPCSHTCPRAEKGCHGSARRLAAAPE